MRRVNRTKSVESSPASIGSAHSSASSNTQKESPNNVSSSIMDEEDFQSTTAVQLTPLIAKEVGADSESGSPIKGVVLGGEQQQANTGMGLSVPMGRSSPILNSSSSSSAHENRMDAFFAEHCSSNPEFFKQVFKFALAFVGLQMSYLTWGYMQELIMTTVFTPTPRVPDGKFPSAAFCVFSNRFLAVVVALIAVRIRHGAFFANNRAPLWAFTPCAFSNTMSSWSQYASLKYVSFPVQTVFKSSKIIPVMIMGKVLKGTSYPWTQYGEAFLITAGVAIFSLLSKSGGKETATEFIGLVFLLSYVSFDSFTAQWQDQVYHKYGRPNVDPYQMMLGVNVSAICITTAGLILTGDLPIVFEFLAANPIALKYNIITAITSASGQLCIFYTIKEFGPIVFTIIMTTRQMFSICISSVVFGHAISPFAASGAALVFGVIFYQIRRKYRARMDKNNKRMNGSDRGGGMETTAMSSNTEPNNSGNKSMSPLLAKA